MKFLKAIVAVAAPAVLTFSAVTSAQVITVPNFSFENPGGFYAVTGTAQGAPTNGGLNVVPGWTFANNEWSGTYGGAGEDGVTVAFVNTWNSGPASITSTNSLTTIAANTDYLLTVAVGNPSGTGGFAQPAPVTLNLLASTFAAPTVFSIAATNLTPIDQTTIPDGTYKDFTVDLTPALAAAFAGGQLKIQMALTDPDGTQYQTTFDNVRLVASSVPEPSTYALMIGGLSLLGFCVRRRLA